MEVVIKPIEPHQTAEAKRLILSVARNILQWQEPLDDIIERFDERGELADVDNPQSHYVERGGIFLVALDQGRLIGTGAVRGLDGGLAELKRLWVLGDYHGQGIGFRLVQALFSFARAAGYKRVRLLTDLRQVRALHLYERLGFQRLQRESKDPDDDWMDVPL